MMFPVPPEYTNANSSLSERRRHINPQNLPSRQDEYSWQQGLAQYKRLHVSETQLISNSTTVELMQQNLHGKQPTVLAQEIIGRLDQEKKNHILTELLTSVISSLQIGDMNKVAESFSSCIQTTQEDDSLTWYEPKPYESPDIERAFRQAMGAVAPATNEYVPIYTDEEIAAF